MKDWKTIAHEKQAERLQRLNAELLSSIDPKVDMLDDNEQYHLATGTFNPRTSGVATRRDLLLFISSAPDR